MFSSFILANPLSSSIATTSLAMGPKTLDNRSLLTLRRNIGGSRTVIARRIKRKFAKLRSKGKVLARKTYVDSWRIHRGDKVEVIVGKDKGKQGTVKRILRPYDSLFVSDVNVGSVKVRIPGAPRAAVIVRERPIHYAKVQLVDPSTGKPTKVGMKTLEDGTKVRYSKSTGAIIPKPNVYVPLKRETFSNDTTPDEVLKATYVPLSQRLANKKTQTSN